MTKYFYFLIISLSVIINLFSQEINIPTEFSQNGKLYKNQNDSSVVLAQFEANEECLVISYLGKDQYKIKYKDYIGFVDSQYLVYLRDKWNKNFSEGSRTIELSEKSRHINNENPIVKLNI